MILLPVIGFLAGFFAIWYYNVTIPSAYASYISLAAIAGIDTILGGIRSGLEGRFQSDVFLSGFLVNTFMAALLAYFGDQIGVQDLYLAAVVVLGWRIFLNLSLIRRYVLDRHHPRHMPVAQPGATPESRGVPYTPIDEAPEAQPHSNPQLKSPVEAP